MAQETVILLSLAALVLTLSAILRPSSRAANSMPEGTAPPIPDRGIAPSQAYRDEPLTMSGEAPALQEAGAVQEAGTAVEVKSAANPAPSAPIPARGEQYGWIEREYQKTTSQEGAESLEELLANIVEGIAVKDSAGRYSYVNKPFTRLVERPASEIVGCDDEELFGYVTAQSLAAADYETRATGETVQINEVLSHDGSRIFEVTRRLMGEEDDGNQSIVSVWRERTEALQRSQEREQAMRQAVSAFARSIRFVDPYLGDHAQRLARVASAVAKAMGLSESAVMTIEFAALLSQVGKLSVEPELLRKQERLTQDETIRLRRHVDDTATLLSEFDFGLPVAESIHQMHERLDGSGYPRGLSGDQIKLSGRILGACDVFCARISPRSYRAAILPQEALGVLEQNPHRYDSEVVASLVKVMSNAAGKRLLAIQTPE